jgi:hypothetical protein
MPTEKNIAQVQMFKKSLVIHGFPRTGSSLVRVNLSEYFDVFVEHNHDFSYVPPHTEFTAIVTKRRNLFDCVCSHFVMLRTGEMVTYSGKEYSKFKIDPREFTGLITAYYEFYDKIDLTCYNKVIEIWFEDLVSDPYHLFGKFNLVEKTSYEIIKPSPNRYQNLVTNVDELEYCYQAWLQAHR